MGIHQPCHFISTQMEEKEKIRNEKKISITKSNCSSTLLKVQNVA